MIDNGLLEIITKILKITQKHNVPLMFMGGIAISVWAEPRATYDIDGIIDADITDMNKWLDEFLKEGFSYDKNTPIKLIQNLPFITLVYLLEEGYEIYVDLFLAKTTYAKEALKRKEELKIRGVTIPIIAPEDLVLYKLLAGRNRDIEDVRQILLAQKDKLDMKYMKKWASKLGVITFLEDELRSMVENEAF